MKIRILANTIRYRLAQSEVENFLQNGKVTEVTEFGKEPTDSLRFTLEVHDEPELAVKFEGNNIVVWVPKDTADKWTKTDLIGFEGKATTGADKYIDVLVEKDFMCLNSTEEKSRTC